MLAALWVIIEPMLEKFAVEEAVTLLVKAGVLSATAGSLIKGADELKIAVADIKIYQEYPAGVNGRGDVTPPSQTNINRVE